MARLIERGLVQAAISQQPFEQGYRAMRVIIERLLFHSKPSDDQIFTQNEIKIKNMEEILQKIYRVVSKTPKVAYEGSQTDSPLAFRFYNPDEIIAGRTMREQLRFAMSYWHTMCAGGVEHVRRRHRG